ncbi:MULTISPECIES: beta-ketoacyl-ACP synthase [unclassified Pseudoalteromonas]|uniref:beta-ketoacyl-ACP synthase n=1 Tax=unclassified Pseudoalteromonas TaxID=194690 RepID=UPI0025725176|nr:beta-ketoacyl-ACP synthase [Pseudoalteromonas sp. MM1]BED91171.1 beta-ketoacyl-[acyl-carrier-protein] synthase II [Pseudoalteromonas sp. MM1]
MTFWLNDLGIVSAMGIGLNDTVNSLNNLQNNEASLLLKTKDLSTDNLPFYVGHVDSVPLTNKRRIDTLIDLAFEQISPTLKTFSHIDKSRVAVVIGTSTSGVHDGERARATHDRTGDWPSDFLYVDQELATPAHYIAQKIGALGPCYSISTACTSSAKALISAKALLTADLADIVVCGGVDSLCKLTINGFNALASLSPSVCKPFCDSRDGINIGEGAALFVMSKEAPTNNGVMFLGGGESSDAHHISAPDPSGKGAKAAMKAALDDADLLPSDIDYINAHGTATIKNDEMEALAINSVFGNNTPLSSSKYLTGHTLGAAGAIEAGICWLLLRGSGDITLPYNKSTKTNKLADVNIIRHASTAKLNYCLSNSFAFGGNNASLILGTHNE